MKRTKHNLSHYNLFTSDMGALVPIGLTEVLPGDSIQQSTSMLLRVSPMVTPVMHPVQVRVHHWFVPNRIVWDGWEDFITSGPDGMDVQNIPSFASGTTQLAKAIGDYYGIPPGADLGGLSTLPFLGYEKIFNEWYRDQDLVPEKTGTISNTMPFKCAWGKDYFTTARPWPQKGPDVTLPLGQQAPIKSDLIASTSLSVLNGADQYMNMGAASSFVSMTGTAGVAADRLYADLSTASAANVNDIRKAFALQRYAEARARYGSRYTEYLRYLGVRSSDARLQRPEFLGGGKTNISFSEVLKTGAQISDTDSAIGSMYGHGISAVRSNNFRRFFEEHGYIHTFMSVRPQGMYTQGINRTFLKKTREDFWQKELEHIGQQEVFTREIYANAAPDAVFGYSDRYQEYRKVPNRISSEFRDQMDMWHMGRVFAAEPTLNASFVECDPTKRIHAVQTEDVLWVMAQHRIAARRLVSPFASGKIF